MIGRRRGRWPARQSSPSRCCGRLAGKLPPEARRRVEILLADIGRWPLPTLQKVRAVQALELIGTARAREVLEKLAWGIPEARLTREAQDALARLSRPH